MRTNKLKARIAAGEPALGCFLGLGSPTVAELFSHAGFDWLVIETEHNGLDSAEIQQMLMAMSGSSLVPLVRVPSSEHVFIQRALDIGAMGVVVPMIRSVAEAEAVVRATRYPPEGSRSFGPLRASRYSYDNADYLYRANENIIVILILETPQAAAEMELIARIPGVDGLWLGTFDLCLGLGLDPLKMPHPEIDAIVARALELGRETGMAIGQNAFTPEMVRKRLDEGYTLIGYGPDYQLLTGVLTEGVAAFRDATGEGVRSS
jgi:2-keto-3-deoxy-L-rhamnonate aldolase RhmA